MNKTPEQREASRKAAGRIRQTIRNIQLELVEVEAAITYAIEYGHGDVKELQEQIDNNNKALEGLESLAKKLEERAK